MYIGAPLRGRRGFSSFVIAALIFPFEACGERSRTGVRPARRLVGRGDGTSIGREEATPPQPSPKGREFYPVAKRLLTTAKKLLYF